MGLHPSAVTIQVKVADFAEGSKWYENLFNRPPDFTPHEHFSEWQIVPNCWLQVVKGTPIVGSGPLRFGVADIESERFRIIAELGVEVSEIETNEQVPVSWCNFQDPYGNRLGFFQDIPHNE